MRNFNRIARVVAWVPKPDSFFEVANATNALIIKDLRIQFKSELTLKKQPNVCEITITNANEETRTFLQTKPIKLRLEVGYDGTTRQLFSGDLRWGASTWKAPQWETKLQVADGDRAFRFGHVNVSLKPGGTVLDAIEQVSRALQIPVPRNLAKDPNTALKYNGGLSLYGEAQQALSELLEPLGYTWSIQNGRLQALQRSELAPGEAFRIDPTTGLKGSPEVGSPDKNKGTPVCTVKTLIDPRIYPGALVDLQSRNVRGLYKVVKVSHEGDNTEGEFETTLELVAK